MQQYADSPWLLDVFTKASVLLGMVWLGSILIRKCSAAAQHRWWTLGFLGCLLVPVLSVVAPTWTPPLIFGSKQSSQQPTADRVPIDEARTVFTHKPNYASRAFDGAADVTQRATLIPAQSSATDERPDAPVRRRSNSPEVATAVSLAPPRTVGESPMFQWSRTFLIVWFFGFAVVLFRRVRQHWMLKSLLGRCTSVEDADWVKLLSESSHMLGVRRNVGLLEDRESNSPVSAGFCHPVVILPEDARNWSHERRRIVLLHELAHVARRDVLAQALAGLGCALHWFNPIAWYGLLQMRRLREVACDDLVLSCGQHPAGYADVLLDIARSYRHQTYANAVGMAHSNNVENRIFAILDKTRRHVTLSRAAARTLFAFTAVLVCLVGTAQLRSQAESSAATTGQETESVEQADEFSDDNLRTMEIRILDAEGKPLEGAMLTASVWYIEGYEGDRTPKKHSADANGTIMLRLPKRLEILRLWPKQPGYVGLFKNFGQGTHREGELIPDDFEFRLPKGHQIGGQVVDEEGNPIEGVHVRVKVDDTEPGISTWLTDSFDQPTVQTDSKGHWQLNNAPALRETGGDCTFAVKLSHDEYVTDKYWGESQKAQDVGSAELRRGNATIVLHGGTSIHGTVVDLEGKSISEGWVVWSDEPYFNDGVYEAELEADGSFRTPPLPDGEVPITIVAPGFAAARRVIHLGRDPSEQRFELRPGKQITIHFVDPAGNPVPNAAVGLASSSDPNTWQGSNALHNHKHPNVPEYGIPRRADEEGVFVWEWAPEEPVRYSVEAKGFAPKEVSLVATRYPHTITLAGARVATGVVTDATTGKRITKFQAMPVIVFRANFFSTRYADVKQGIDGRYELPLTGSGDPNDRYRVRVEADGYRSVISEDSFGPMDGTVQLNVQLEPAPMRRGRVVDADGKPVAGASVIEGTPTWVPHTRNGEPTGWGERIGKTDSEGLFVLNATTEPVRVRALHEAGTVEKLLQPEVDYIGDLQLQPWAKVSGRLLQDGTPIGNQSIYFNSLVRRGLGQPRFQDSYHASSSSDGGFCFDRLPPGSGSLRPHLGPWRDSPLTSAESLPLELKVGENRDVVLGGNGAVLTGQVVATGRDEAPLDRNWSLNYLISRDRIVREIPADFPGLSFDPSSPVQLSWSLDPHFGDWVATRENHFVKLTPDGHLRVTGVAPGHYDLIIRLYEQPAGCLIETVGEKLIPVHVGGDGRTDIGRIEVPCRAGPRPGSDMRVFEFVDTIGRKRSVNDMAGRYVLMHVWASWCASCLEYMPDIQHMAESVTADTVTFVGLNMDEDSTGARDLARRMGWNWSQNYLGDDSDMARQLAISSVPTYYLIAPDGKLAASATEWTEIKRQLVASLSKPATKE